MNKKIFVSSTCFDLIDFRAEIKEYLESIGFIPIMSDQNNSEFVTLPDQNSIETCLVNLRACDTVVFVLSKRYGGKLGKAGFDDVSATHLEYLEAKKHNKRIFFFVRDRLLADFNHAKKSKSLDGLLWIDKSEIQLFDIIEDRKSLANEPIDNWLTSYRHVLDVKERLAIELKPEIKAIRLNKLIESGNIPFLNVWVKAETIKDTNDLLLEFEILNVGNQVAINPVLALFKAKTYKEVTDQNMYSNRTNYEIRNFKSLLPQTSCTVPKIKVTVDNEQMGFVASVLYKTMQGDLLTDVSEIGINVALKPSINTSVRYTTKHFMAEDTYERLS